MNYLIVIETFTTFKIKESETEAAARLWLKEEIKDLKRYYPYHNWEEKWVIYPYEKAIRYKKEKVKRPPTRVSKR